MDQLDFDNACAAFTMTMGAVANWKHTYPGAAYSTRLRAAIADAKGAISRMELMLERDKGKSENFPVI